MKNLTINGKTYEPQIEGENIGLIGLDDCIYLMGAGLELEELANDYATCYGQDYDDDGFSGTSSFINKEVKQDYILENLVSFCQNWVKSGQEMTVENFNLN